MESKSLFDLFAKLNPTDEQVKEFFIYFCSHLNDVQLDGIFYGMELCGKDMKSEEGEKLKKEITKMYNDKLPSMCQSMIDAFSRSLIEDVEESLNVSDIVETTITEAVEKKKTTTPKKSRTTKKPTDRKKPGTTKKRTSVKKEDSDK